MWRVPGICLLAGLSFALGPPPATVRAELPPAPGGVELVDLALDAPGAPPAHLLLPADAATDPLPAAVIHPALAGPLRDTGRRSLANRLAASGWAVLEISLDGVGGSRQELARSVVAAYGLLAAHPRVDGTEIGLIGLLEGADVVAVASAEIGSPAFVVAASGGAAPVASFDPTSWWWTLDAPLLFIFGSADPRLEVSRQRIDEAIRPEGILVTVEVVPGLDEDLAGADGALAGAAASRIERWLAGVLAGRAAG